MLNSAMTALMRSQWTASFTDLPAQNTINRRRYLRTTQQNKKDWAPGTHFGIITEPIPTSAAPASTPPPPHTRSPFYGPSQQSDKCRSGSCRLVGQIPGRAGSRRLPDRLVIAAGPEPGRRPWQYQTSRPARNLSGPRD